MDGKNKLRYTCIFGGGAIRGIAYIGVVRALKELDVEIEAYSGSSVGAIFAAFLAVGYDSEELYELFSHINMELFKDINFSFINGFAISKGEVFYQWLKEVIEKGFYKDAYDKGKNEPVTFANLEKDLIILATDIKNCSVVEFSKEKTPDYEVAKAIKISASFPGLLKPFEYEDKLLVDGDMVKSWPLWRITSSLLKKGTRILEFRLEGGKEHNQLNSLIDYINSVYCCISSYSTDFVIDLYNHKDMFDYIKIDVKTALMLDFNVPRDKRDEIVELGYTTTMNHFRDKMPKKKTIILNAYTDILDYFIKIRNSLHSNKIITAKNQLGELFMELSTSKEVINKDFFNKIIDFKILFMENIEKPKLFQTYKLKNKNCVIEKFEGMLNELEETCEELKAFLDSVRNNSD